METLLCHISQPDLKNNPRQALVRQQTQLRSSHMCSLCEEALPLCPIIQNLFVIIRTSKRIKHNIKGLFFPVCCMFVHHMFWVSVTTNLTLFAKTQIQT